MKAERFDAALAVYSRFLEWSLPRADADAWDAELWAIRRFAAYAQQAACFHRLKQYSNMEAACRELLAGTDQWLPRIGGVSESLRISLMPLVAEAHYWIGWQAVNRKAFDEAASEYGKASDVWPEGALAESARHRQALAFSQDEQPAQAVDAYLRLLKDHPANKVSRPEWLWLAKWLMDAGRGTEAFTVFEAVLAREPAFADKANVLYWQAEIRRRAEEWDAALGLYEAAAAEGVGLFRTEYLFRGEPDEPSLAEQVAFYRPVFKRFGGRKVVIRTLDVGSDKPLPYLVDFAWKGGDPMGGAKGWKGVREPNPALGVRGLRTAGRHPEVLDRQLEAIVKAAAGTDAEVWALAPMVSTPDEAAWFKRRCVEHGVDMAGAMIEVPAAALTARWIAEEVDFLSVGTNDLTSYVMAADRDLGALADLTSPWQPGHLALIAAACQGARDGGGRPVSVCGEAAADPYLAPVLVGLGATSLSMGPPALGTVAAVLGSVTLARCRELARIATGARDAETAKRLVREALPQLV
ncbi:MAG: hypothetical protein FWG11_07500 [Promicromonosporaceae bacterium]|nr:hypothetical protein [Promicromonosporaceae bacterium]